MRCIVRIEQTWILAARQTKKIRPGPDCVGTRLSGFLPDYRMPSMAALIAAAVLLVALSFFKVFEI